MGIQNVDSKNKYKRPPTELKGYYNIFILLMVMIVRFCSTQCLFYMYWHNYQRFHIQFSLTNLINTTSFLVNYFQNRCFEENNFHVNFN